MSRLIDGDALKSALAHAAKDYCNRNGPMRAIDFESLIDKAPTVDAIPVEWLRKWPKDLREGAYVRDILRDWQKEQEAK